MGDEVKTPVALNPIDEGGTVTTVKKNVTSDLDVQQQLKEQEEQQAAAAPKKDKEEEPKKPAQKAEVKDDDEKFDREKLTPAQRKEFDRLAADQRRLRRQLNEARAEREETPVRTPKPQQQERRETAPARQTHSDGRPVRPRRPDPMKFNDPVELDRAEEQWEKDEEQYQIDLARFVRDEDVKKTKANEADQQHQVRLAKYDEDQEAFAAEHDDYFEVMDTNQQMSNIMFGAVLEYGPWLGYEMVKSGEAAKIVKMNDAKQVEAIMRMVFKHQDAEAEAKKDEEAEKKPTKGTQPSKEREKAPDPPNPVSGGRVAVEVDRSKMSFKEREAARRKADPHFLNYD